MHYTFGLPGLLGGIAYIVLMMLQVNWTKNLMWVSWLTPSTALYDAGGNVPGALSWGMCIQCQALSRPQGILIGRFIREFCPASTLYEVTLSPGHLFFPNRVP